MATAFTDEDAFYKMDASPKGICLIINNFEFKRSCRMDTGPADKDNLARTFSKLDFEVRYLENLTCAQMIMKMEHIQREDHSMYDCFVCCINSHGNANGVCGADDYAVSIEELQGYIYSTECSSLAGKPKVFFVDACRGSEGLRGHYPARPATPGREAMMADKRDIRPSTASREAPPARGRMITDKQDFLMSFSTTRGNMSYNNPDPTKGSLYLHHLTRLLDRYANSKTVLQILNMLTDAMADDSPSCAQASEHSSTLRKELVFCDPEIFKKSKLVMADEGEEELIRRKIFPCLTNNLGAEWSRFIAVLPGWKSTRANVVIEHKKEEETTVPNRIFACLMTWQQECPMAVKVQSILSALGDDGVNRTDLREEVERLAHNEKNVPNQHSS